jgi:peroxiredoxin
MAELGEFVKHYDEIKALGARVIGISVDPVEKALITKQKLHILFPILSDSGRKVMELYGTRSPVYYERDGSPLNTPTLVLVDRKGIVRWVHQAANYRIRPPISEDLMEIRKLR